MSPRVRVYPVRAAGEGSGNWVLIVQGGSYIAGVVAIGGGAKWHNLGAALVVEIGGNVFVCSFGPKRSPRMVRVDSGSVFHLEEDPIGASGLVVWGNEEVGARLQDNLSLIGMSSPEQVAQELTSLFTSMTGVEGTALVAVVDVNADGLILRVEPDGTEERVLSAGLGIRKCDDVLV